MWSPLSHNRPPRAPSAGLLAHHENPEGPRTTSCRGIPANGLHQGGRARVPPPYLQGRPGGGAGVRAHGSPRADRLEGTRVLSLPLRLEGQPATQKGCVGVGVWEVFQGHQLVPAGRPHPTHTPPGRGAPLSAEHHPGGGGGAGPAAASSCGC